MGIERARNSARTECTEDPESYEHERIDIRSDAASKRYVAHAQTNGACRFDDRSGSGCASERDRFYRARCADRFGK